MNQQARPAAVVALGMFDGMHLGHQALIRQTAELAKAEGCLAAVDTFSNHPAEVLGGKAALLSDSGERAQRMRALGIGQVHMERFTKELAQLSPESFIAALLSRWDVRALVAGFNYTFGCGGQGTPDTLRFFGRRYGFDVTVTPPAMLLGEPVSSSRIRAALAAGDVGGAKAMLGRPYALAGTVMENRHIGSAIGFPTANLEPDKQRALPKFGVYGTLVRQQGHTWAAVTNVGDNPTVGGDKVTVESHLLNFDGTLYGESILVEFVFHVRDQRRFQSVEALREQIALDKQCVLERMGEARQR